MYFSCAGEMYFQWMKQSSSHVWLTIGMDQLAALLVLLPSMLNKSQVRIRRTRRRRRRMRMSLQGGDEYSVLLCHACGKFGTQYHDKLLEVVASFTSVVRHSYFLDEM